MEYSVKQNLEWRYATKKFDSTRQIPNETIKQILETTNLAPTSLGIQAYRIIHVKDTSLRLKLAEHSRGEQIKTASSLIVLAACTNVNENFIHTYMDYAATIRTTSSKEDMAVWEERLLNYIKTFSKDYALAWSRQQVHIALGVLLTACAEARVDACPMGAIERDEFDRLLNLSAKNLTAELAIPLGYRAKEDALQQLPKVRLPLSEMVLEY